MTSSGTTRVKHKLLPLRLNLLQLRGASLANTDAIWEKGTSLSKHLKDFRRSLRGTTYEALWLCDCPGTYPLGRRNPETVLLHVEATGEPHLQHEIQVLAVLCLPALPPAVSPHKVKETTGQDEEPAGVGRPGGGRAGKSSA